MKKDDIKMKNWFNFSLGTTRKDKRRRKQLFLEKYFINLKLDWETIFTHRGIILDISKVADIEMRVFEIDFDSIFSNLFVNFIDAFNISKENRQREIVISVNSNEKEIVIDYVDNGPGLSKDISEPDVIFTPMFTTKKNEFTGEDEGTGLGMWILKSVVEENDGFVKLLYPNIGFGVRMIFPIKHRR
jgi:C4-dicarboxylate-specific signal transduction histidine kinase